MKLKTFLIVECLGGLFTLSSCTAPTNVKDYSAYVNPVSYTHLTLPTN